MTGSGGIGDDGADAGPSAGGEPPIDPAAGALPPDPAAPEADDGEPGAAAQAAAAAALAHAARSRRSRGEAASGSSAGLGFLLFALGIVSGFPLAMVGVGFVAANLGALATLLLAILGAGSVFVLLLLVFRGLIWQRLFRVVNVQIDRFASPLAEMARHAAEARPTEAAEAARRFAELALARWAWVSTRRWVIASSTGLIAALAALAGSALLFRQNELLEEQTRRLDQQNQLIEVQVEVSEAERSAAMIPELSRLADLIDEVVRALPANEQATPVIDSADLPPGLRARIVAATLAARPYRPVVRWQEAPLDEAKRRRDDLPTLHASITTPPPPMMAIADRAVSPERGLILAQLTGGGVRNFGQLAWQNVDFRGAFLPNCTLTVMDFRHLMLERADFSGCQLAAVRLGGAWLGGSHYTKAVIRQSSFATLGPGEAAKPFDGEAVWATQLGGASFTGAIVAETSFAGVQALLSRFDGALIWKASFAGASLGGAEFDGALILATDFAGADLRSVDFDGAYVIGDRFLTDLAAAAEPASFDASRYRLEPATRDEILAVPTFWEHLGVEVPESAIDGDLRRVVRIKPFQ